MVESSDEPSLLNRIRFIPSKSHASLEPVDAGQRHSAAPLGDFSAAENAASSGAYSNDDVASNDQSPAADPTDSVVDTISSALPPAAPPPHEGRQGEEPSTIEPEEVDKKPNIATRFYECCRTVLFASWTNVLLVFVPVGIAVQVAGVDKNIVFAMNAIAIVPLAGLLSHATESVASDMGDTIGALMNVTFGNAVELIIL